MDKQLSTKEILNQKDNHTKFNLMYDKGDMIKSNQNLDQIISELNQFLKEVLDNNNMNRGELRTIGIICKPAKNKGLDKELWSELINRLNNK